MTPKIGPIELEKEIYKRKIQELEQKVEELERNKMDTRKKKNTGKKKDTGKGHNYSLRSKSDYNYICCFLSLVTFEMILGIGV